MVVNIVIDLVVNLQKTCLLHIRPWFGQLIILTLFIYTSYSLKIDKEPYVWLYGCTYTATASINIETKEKGNIKSTWMK